MLLLGECLTMAAPDRVGAVLVYGERIADLGSAEELCARYPGEPRVRVERITPGVHDAHAHPLLWGQSLGELDLAGVTDPREVAARVAQRSGELPPGRWIRGRGFLFDTYPAERLLDDAAPRNPVLVESRDIHSAWVNAAALRVAEITAVTSDPVGGVILRDTTGEPSGYLLESAAQLVAKVVPPPAKGDLERGLADLAGRGYTAIHAMAYPGPDDLEWLEELARAEALPLRVWKAVAKEKWQNTEPGWRGDDLEVAAVKLFADGALGSRTAWMFEPYAGGGCGMPLDDGAALLQEGRAALGEGFTLAIHAIGTRAVAEVAAVIRELSQDAHRRMRIEHVQHVRDDELTALAGLPVALSMQPVHLLGDAELIRRHLPGREAEAFRFRDLWRLGLPIAFGSDAPVAKPDIADSLRVATQHPLSPRQSLTREEALFAFTRGAALAAGWVYYGVLAVKARADLALWEGDRLVGRVWRGRVEWL